jgi:hypothetical protein
MYFLIINDLVDVKNKKITHYSLDKGLNLGYGFVNNGCKVDYIISTNSFIEDNINFINFTELTEDKINSYDYIIIVREGFIEELFNKFKELKNIFFNCKRKTKIIIKSDSCNWILDKNFRKFINKELSINGSIPSVVKWINKNIDIICVQNNEFYELGISNGINKERMLISNMAVPNLSIDYDSLVNPYLSDYSYCKDKRSLTSGDSLFPLYYINNPDKIGELNNKKRTKIFYMGRIKTDSGKIIYIMKDIIEKLGDDYELHIFSGSFLLYNLETHQIQKCSANNTNHLELLRDTVFPENKNVFIHCPFNHKDIHKYLWYADIGIDFSSSRPNNVKANAGNAKLLEYCYMGLPVVTEKNVNNSFLVSNCSNGILLEGIGTTDDYIQSIIKLTNKIKINRKNASKITIKNENWNIRAKDFINDLKIKFN